MKKYIAMVLALMMILSLAGCGQEVEESAESEQGKTKLTLACFVLMPYIEDKINEFNNTNPDYYIEVLDYSEYDTQDDFSAGETKLNTDIIGGNTPDIIELGKMPVEVYTNKGLMEDLNNFLKNDETLSEDDFVSGAINALSTNGALYRVSPCFTVTTLYGKESKIGDKSSWTLGGLQNCLNANEDITDPFINMPPAQILHSLTMYTMGQFVDSENGECSFDSPEFVKLLELVNKYSKNASTGYREPNPELLNNAGLLSTMYISNINNFVKTDNELNSDLNVIGFPTEEGSGNIAEFQFSFGVFADSEHKDGAWQFLKSLFEEEYQDSLAEFETPVLLSSYNKMLQKSDASETQTEKYNRIINSINKSSSFDGTLMNIIAEEANALFEGQRSAEDVANSIQSRAKIYISESR